MTLRAFHFKKSGHYDVTMWLRADARTEDFLKKFNHVTFLEWLTDNFQILSHKGLPPMNQLITAEIPFGTQGIVIRGQMYFGSFHPCLLQDTTNR